MCFLVVSTLFDVMSFPHVPYIFLWMAAMLAVMTDAGPGGGGMETLSVVRILVRHRLLVPARRARGGRGAASW